jgi:hypothetical protein
VTDDDDGPLIFSRRAADWHGPRPGFARYAPCRECGEQIIYTEATARQARAQTGREPIFVCVVCVPLPIIAGGRVQEPSATAFAQAQEILGKEVAREFFEQLTGKRPKDA